MVSLLSDALLSPTEIVVKKALLAIAGPNPAPVSLTIAYPDMLCH
jgi:hypothetical protein